MKYVIPFGGGVNSVAMCILLVQQSAPIDHIVFSNTGGFSNKGEKAETYRYIRLFSKWLVKKGYPPVKTVFYNSEGLYDELIRRKSFPAIAFGFKSCSEKWKIRPYNKYLKSIGVHSYTKYVGYDAGEAHRVKDYDSDGVLVRYPLVDAGFDRFDCVRIIVDAGLPVPPKSSCFFCPNMSPGEVFHLRDMDADRFALALELEANVDGLSAIRGLARSKKWSEITAQGRLDFSAPDPFDLENMPCPCSL
jgi:hypothetical protein